MYILTGRNAMWMLIYLPVVLLLSLLNHSLEASQDSNVCLITSKVIFAISRPCRMPNLFDVVDNEEELM